MAGNVTENHLLEGIGGLQEYFTWETGLILMGFNLKRHEDGFLLVVSARRKGGNRVVAFFGAAHETGCLEKFFYECTHKPGIRWLPDKFAK